jgi:non-ribosomal peptide synthetase component E (peptide arylation enzyme)
MLNLAMLLEDSTREVPERTAIVCEETRLSYAE